MYTSRAKPVKYTGMEAFYNAFQAAEKFRVTYNWPLYFVAAIRSGSRFSAFGVPRPVTGFQPGPAE